MIKITRTDKIVVPLVLLAAGAYGFYRLDPLYKPDTRRVSLIEEGKERSQVMDYLTRLCTDVGTRLTGSPGLEKAEKWAVEEFKQIGLDEVRLEKWGEAPVSWTRGSRQYGRLLEPVQLDLPLTTPAWMPGTDGLEKAEVVLYPKDIEEAKARAQELKGKWVLMSIRAQQGGAPGESPALAEELDRIGIRGRLIGSVSDLLYTAGPYAKASFALRESVPRIILRSAEAAIIRKSLEKGERVVAEFEIENIYEDRKVPHHNVIAEIKGIERPEEVVILSAHLDSWDSPGSQGALDNGVGVAVTLEAARILKAFGKKPKRTIQFCLWSSEEQGMLGARHYVETRWDSLHKIVAMFNDDGGTGYHGGYQITREMERDFNRALEPMKDAFPNLPQELQVYDELLPAGGSDHVAFYGVGVPAFFTLERGRNEYGKAHHTQYDSLELAVEENMIQSATEWAVLAWYFANEEVNLPHRKVERAK
jgi:carboxypeptidase Q